MNELINEKTISQKELPTLLSIQQALTQLPKTLYLPLLNIALASFKQNALDNRIKIYAILEKIAAIEPQDLFDFVVVAVIGKAVDSPFPVKENVKYSRYQDILPELTALISLVVLHSQEKKEQASQFAKVMANFTHEKVAMKEDIAFDATYLRTILASLNQLTPLCKEQVIYAVIDSIATDKKITLEEAALIRGIAAGLDCPIPPFVGQ